MYRNKKKRRKNAELNSLYKEAEFDREHSEVKEIETRIRSFVDEIAEYIGRQDPLFKNFVIPSGSFYEDLKVEGPDEFDFMICLEELSKPGVCVSKDIPSRPVPDPGYVHVQVAEKVTRHRWKGYISKSENLNPDVLLARFRHLIENAVKNRKRTSRDKMGTIVYVEFRKIPVTVKVMWNGTKYPNYEIAIDLTLCIRMSGWPTASDIRERVARGHPGYEMFQEAFRSGHHLVASTYGESGEHRPCWRLSFSIPEGIVLKGIFKDSKLVCKVALKVLKVLRKKNEDNLCLFENDTSYSVTWAFHSYVLKTMFLHEWTEFPEDSYWIKAQLRKRVKGILQRIRNSVISKDIRSFWVPDYKLFNFRARKVTETERCVDKISQLLDKLEL